MASTICLWRMTEPDGVLPADLLGNLDNLHTEPGINAPTSIDAFTGKGRQFAQASSQALLAGDLSRNGTLLQRDASVQAILSLTLTGAAGAQTIYAHGLHDGNITEQYSLGLEVMEHPNLPGYVMVYWFWETSGAVIVTEPAGVFQHPGDGKLFLLTATRRWQSTSSVVVRYYVNDQQIAEIETTDGDIGGGTLGTTTVGGRKNAGAWEHFLNGTIDELALLDYELSPEEIRHTYKRLTVYQPNGVAMFAGLIPPGLPWFKNPGNNIGRRVKVAGQVLGLGIAANEELRDQFLPDRAPLSRIPLWETLCGLSPKPRDSLDARRARVVGYLSREEGFAIPCVQTALATVLDVPDPSTDIQIIEATNAVTDSFDTLDTDQKWLAGPVGAWTAAGGALQLDVPAATDIRIVGGEIPCHLRIPLDSNSGRVYAGVKLSGFGVIPASTGVGILMVNRVTWDGLWFGVYNDAGTLKIAYQLITAHVPGAVVELAAAANANTWLRVLSTDGGAAGAFDMAWSTTGPSTGFTTQAAVATTLLDGQWAGIGAWSTIAAPAADIVADFDDFAGHAFDGLRVFQWYAFRDPATPGAPDIVGGRALVQKTKPAHTAGDVVERLSVLCDDDRFGLCDQNPCGAW